MKIKADNSLLMKIRKNEDGATAVEYGLIVGLIAVVVIVAVTALGTSVGSGFAKVTCKIQGKTWTAGTPDNPTTEAVETTADTCA